MYVAASSVAAGVTLLFPLVILSYRTRCFAVRCNRMQIQWERDKNAFRNRGFWKSEIVGFVEEDLCDVTYVSHGTCTVPPLSRPRTERKQAHFWTLKTRKEPTRTPNKNTDTRK